MKPRFTLPAKVKAEVLCNGRPTEGLFLWARIETSFKNDFSSLIGPSDARGFVSFTRDDLLLNGERDRTLFIMDYGHPEIHYTGFLNVVPASREELRRAIDAHRQFQQVVSFPPHHAEQLQEACLKLDRLAPATLEAVLTVQGGTGTVAAVGAEA
jgi:hypothetical protein